MSDFFEKIKVNAFKTKDEAVKLGKQVKDKAENAVEKTKLTFSINDADNKIKEIYSEIGEKIYSAYHENGQNVEEFEEEFGKIDDLVKEKEALQRQLQEINNSVKCDNCGEYNKSDSTFCSKCGELLSGKREDNTYEETEPAQTIKRVVTIKAKKPDTEGE